MARCFPHEAQGIKRIVDVICKTSFSPNIYVDEGLVGMGTRLNDMKSRLKVGAGGVRMVGIWGLGGSGVTVLRQKALITTLDGTFDMHDLVQEMAFYIVRGDHPNNPEEHSRIWQSKKINEMCSSNATIQENYKIEAIQYYSEQIEAIQYHGEQYHIEDVPSHFFKHVSSMKKLRFLSVTTYCNGCNEGPTFLSHELRYIQMSCRLERSLPVNCQLKKLVVLKLDSSLQEELWKGKKA
ncbi:hypothetical protein L1987_39551 [Smallanthus sonchifolius]|uniref:Uncharacterized protein n=1 Tax=Smallanthus sonchifolius TaxID=185202 RepID=A0ACB9HP25_9ASTR|nr:hypothetical protein L1987_39551 [Smallanthus sonchifolius]